MGSSSAEECSRTVVWCCPAEWPAAVEGEGCLNDRLRCRLGLASRSPCGRLRRVAPEKAKRPRPRAAPPTTIMPPPQLLLTDPETGIPAVAIRGMALVSAKSGPLMAQTVRNVLLFMDSLRSQVLCGDSAAGSPPRSQAVETAIAAWPSFVRQVTAHCRATLLLEPQVPSLPQLTSDGALLE
eukprot:jgi/Tetstr1/432149/TSEL_021606.t1